ncbi:hypothetical protein JXB12_11985 [candidate division KSB1 bacterium]|nr:hypothetical protein [candidate division KSB1 bacterium]
MKRLFTIILIIGALVFGGNSLLYSQIGYHGGRGLLHVLSANVVEPGDVYVNTYFSMYFEKASSHRLAKLYTLFFNGTVGLSRHFELSVHTAPYQDDQEHIFGRYGNSELSLKYMLPVSSSIFQMGLNVFYKVPTAQESNVMFENFYLDEPGLGGRALFTLDFTKTASDLPFKLMTNIGYLDNDLSDSFMNSPIDQLLFGAGVKFPVRNTQFYMEYSGELFINVIDSVPFNENANRITLGSTFLGPKNLVIDIAGDIGLDKRLPTPEHGIYNKKLARWRLWLGVTYRFSVRKYFDPQVRLERMKQEEERRKLEMIKEKRKQANQDMDKMRDVLEQKEQESEN